MILEIKQLINRKRNKYNLLGLCYNMPFPEKHVQFQCVDFRTEQHRTVFHVENWIFTVKAVVSEVNFSYSTGKQVSDKTN